MMTRFLRGTAAMLTGLRQRRGQKARKVRDGARHRSGLAVVIAISVALSQMPGVGPWDARAAAQEPASELCAFLKKRKKKVKPCVGSADVEDDGLKSRDVRRDAAQFKGESIPLHPVGLTPGVVEKIKMELPADGLVIVAATVEIAIGAGGSGGTVFCLIAPGGSGAGQANQTLFGSVDKTVRSTMVYANRGFKAKQGKFTARLVCSIVTGSSAVVSGSLTAQYVAKRY